MYTYGIYTYGMYTYGMYTYGTEVSIKRPVLLNDLVWIFSKRLY